MHGFLALILAIFLVNQAAAGNWAANGFVYKPALGARGQAEKNAFDAGLDRVDAHLGKYKTLGDPNYATLTEALNTIQTSQVTLIIPAGVVAVAANTTIPANVHLMVLNGGRFAVADGVTLTINGPLAAGLYQIFSCSGSGKVVFGPGAISQAYPEWWGAKADGVTDCAAAFQAAVNAFNRIALGRGTYVIDNTTLYFNYSGSAKWNWIVYGVGTESVLDFKNFNSGTYCVKVNEDANGDKVMPFPSSPNLVLENLYITAENSSTPYFCKIRETGIVVRQVWLKLFDYGFRTEDYVDLFRAEQVTWWAGTTSGYFYEQAGAGDGAFLNQVTGFRTTGSLHDFGLARFAYCHGGTVLDCIGGRINLYRASNTVISGWHTEDVGNHYHLVSENSSFTLRDSFLSNNHAGNGCISLAWDTTAANYSALIQNNRFYCFESGPAKNDVYIHGAFADARIILQDNYRQFSDVNDVDHYVGRFAIKVAGSDTDINNACNAWPIRAHFSRHVELVYEGDTWRWVIPGSDAIRLPALADPYIGSIIETSYFTSNLAQGTYYYRVALYAIDSGNGEGLHNARSPESSITTTADNKTVRLTLWGITPYTVLRLWRGTTSGSYNRYVDIPTAHGNLHLNDCGNHVSGYSWITTEVPTTPTVNTSMEGKYHYNGKRVFWASAAPSSSEFTGVRGDLVWNTAPAAAGTPGWVCVTAGSPGTWKAMANLAN